MSSTVETVPPGLSTTEARRRLERDGPNRIVPAPARRDRMRRLLGPLADPMVLLLLVAGPTYLLIGDRFDAVVVFVAIVPIAAVGWVLETRANRALAELHRLTAPTAEVERDGRTQTVPAEDLVVDDLLWLREGDVVPADGAVVAATQLHVDESSLTGESLPVAKTAAGGTGTAVFAGTTVVTGRGLVRVEQTGPRTRYGAIGAAVAATKPPATPLERALARLVTILAGVAAVFCALVVAVEVIHGNGWGDATIAGVSLAIAAIPEEFSMVYALYLAIGAWELADGHALVKRLPTVETLGSTTVICTDKTGTLTRGALSVTGFVAPRIAEPDEPERRLLEAGVLACEPDPYDPVDLALVAEARARGIDVDALHAGTLVRDWPFDPTDAYVTHVWRVDGRSQVAAKGSLEGLLRHGRTPPEVVDDLRRAHDDLAAAGRRVIAVAAGPDDTDEDDRDADERGLELVGLVAFADPVRDGVIGALGDCGEAGIRVIMITGDHPATAHSIAEQLDLPHTDGSGDLIVTGARLDAADTDELESLMTDANVFARVRPDHKLQLVEGLRARGHVVAMTGDGTNDAPALRAAHIGVAMGVRGTQVAREAADMVLLDDNFATIVAAVRNGRRIYDNLTRAFAYLIAFHPPLMLAALVIPLTDRPLLLLPVHLVVLELVLHPIVALVFRADPADADVMQRPPRPADSGLGASALWRPYAIGLALAGGVIGTYLVALAGGWPTDEARAIGLAVLLASQPLLMLVERSPHAPIWARTVRTTRTLWVAAGIVIATTAAAVSIPPLAELLQLAPFPAWGWPIVVAVAATTTLWTEPLKRPIHAVRGTR